MDRVERAAPRGKAKKLSHGEARPCLIMCPSNQFLTLREGLEAALVHTVHIQVPVSTKKKFSSVETTAPPQSNIYVNLHDRGGGGKGGMSSRGK